MIQFIENYLHRDTWIRSDRLFEWFLISHPNYKHSDFLVKLRLLLHENEIKEFNENYSFN